MNVRTFALAIGIALFATASAYAKPDAVPGVSCNACHTAMPPAKTNLNPKASAMLAAHKDVAKCKECHMKGEGGKLATKAPAK